MVTDFYFWISWNKPILSTSNAVKLLPTLPKLLIPPGHLHPIDPQHPLNLPHCPDHILKLPTSLGPHPHDPTLPKSPQWTNRPSTPSYPKNPWHPIPRLPIPTPFLDHYIPWTPKPSTLPHLNPNIPMTKDPNGLFTLSININIYMCICLKFSIVPTLT